MRVGLVRCGVALLCLGLWPSRADAYFWEWIDSMSGPRFKGYSVEWRMFCVDEDLAERTSARSLLTLTEQNLAQLRLFTIDSTIRTEALGAAVTANTLAKRALGRDASTTKVMSAFVDAGQLWLGLSAQLMSAKPPDPNSDEFRREKALAQKAREDADQTADAVGPSLGVILSACPSKPNTIRRSSIDLNIAFGTHDKKIDARNKLVMVGPSFTMHVAPWLDAGVGGGVAWFSAEHYSGFTRLYIEPIRTDIRFADAICRLMSRCSAKSEDGQMRKWLQVPLIRYSMITFPRGFAENSFGTSPGYGAEVIHSLGLHFDLEVPLRAGGKL